MAFHCGLLWAQILDHQMISSLGSSYSPGLIQTSISIGNPVTSTLNQGSFIITQGFQQPLPTDSIYLGILEKEPYGFDITVYPNPTRGQLKLEITTLNQVVLKVDIYNQIGEDIIGFPKFQVNDNITNDIDLSSFSNGLYYLFVNSDNGEVRKIIKVEKIL